MSGALDGMWERPKDSTDRQRLKFEGSILSYWDVDFFFPGRKWDFMEVTNVKYVYFGTRGKELIWERGEMTTGRKTNYEKLKASELSQRRKGCKGSTH